jgi:TrmH family RNA methyltransferase
MITRNQVKMILSLQKRKVREENLLFVIEGDKLVREYLLAGNRVALLAGKPEWLSGISSLKTPHNVLAVAHMPVRQYTDDITAGKLTLALENVQDPGNLGTIIRIAAWFGIGNIICSPECVDQYNPKVIQASMGAFMHVRVWYRPLDEALSEATAGGIPVYGTTMDGQPVYDHTLGSEGIILLGNESRGISESLLKHVTERITIPGPGKSVAGIESLNVSMAAAIICSEFARRRKV